MQPGEPIATQARTTSVPSPVSQATPLNDDSVQNSLLGFLGELAKALEAVTSPDQAPSQPSGHPVQAGNPPAPEAAAKPGCEAIAAPQQTVELLPPNLLSVETIAPQPGDTPSDHPQPKQPARREAAGQAVTDPPAAPSAVTVTAPLPIVAVLSAGAPVPATPQTPTTPPTAPVPWPHVSTAPPTKPNVASPVPPQPTIRPTEQASLTGSAIVPADHQTEDNTAASASSQMTAVDTAGLTLRALPVSPEPATASSPASQISAAPTPHAMPSPAAQIAPVLVSLAHAPDGAQRLTVRLDPPDLGQVQIRIDRPASAPAHVDITVERPETLTLLLRDQPQLQHALDLAGVPSEARSVTFHIAAPEPTSRPEAPTPSTAAGGSASDFSHGESRQGGGPPRRNTDADNSDIDLVPTIAPAGWMRAGLDITA